MNDDLREHAEFLREMFGESAASKAAEDMLSAAIEWRDSFACLADYRAQEPANGWWHNDPKLPPPKQGAARWWVPSDFIPGWGEQGRAA